MTSGSLVVTFGVKVTTFRAKTGAFGVKVIANETAVITAA
jgi:hypothetical protein